MLIDDRKKLIQAEQKRLVDGSMLIGIDTIMRRLDILLESVMNNVKDPEVLEAIQKSYMELINQ